MTKWILLFIAVVLAMVEAMSTSARSVRTGQAQSAANGDYSAIRSTLARLIADGGFDARAYPNQLSSTMTAQGRAALEAAVAALDTPKTQAQITWCQFDLNTYSVTPDVLGQAPTGVANHLGRSRPHEIVAGYFDVVRLPRNASASSPSRLSFCPSAAEFGTSNDVLAYAGSIARVNVYLSEVLTHSARGAWTPASVDAADAPASTVRFFPEEQKLKTNATGSWQDIVGLAAHDSVPGPVEGSAEMLYVPPAHDTRGFWIGAWPAGLGAKGAAVHSPDTAPARSLTQQQAAAACALRGWKLPTFKQWAVASGKAMFNTSAVSQTREAGGGHGGRLPSSDPLLLSSLQARPPTYPVGEFEWLRDTSDRSSYPYRPTAAYGNYYSFAAAGLLASWGLAAPDAPTVTSAEMWRLNGFMPFHAYLSKEIVGSAYWSATVVGKTRVLLPGYPSPDTGAAVMNVAKNNVSEFPDHCTGYCTNTAALAVRVDTLRGYASNPWMYPEQVSFALFVGRSYATPATPASDDITVGFRCVKSME